jgi:hypothetical protein
VDKLGALAAKYQIEVLGPLPESVCNGPSNKPPLMEIEGLGEWFGGLERWQAEPV